MVRVNRLDDYGGLTVLMARCQVHGRYRITYASYQVADDLRHALVVYQYRRQVRVPSQV